jgi:hypothetical protein
VSDGVGSDPDAPEPDSDASLTGMTGTAVPLVTSVEATGEGAGSSVGGLPVGDGCTSLVVGGDATSLVGPASIGGVESSVGPVSSPDLATSFAEVESVTESASVEN